MKILREQSAAGLVAVRGEASGARVRRLSPPSSRCRPGDIAVWVRLAVSAVRADALRAAADGAGVSLDAWLAVMIEFAISLRELSYATTSVDASRMLLAEVDNCPIDVAWLPDWRAWQSSLSRRSDHGRDELPEVVLPQRLLVRSGGTIDVLGALELTADWPLARACELIACGRGQTLEAFVVLLAWPAAQPAAGASSHGADGARVSRIRVLDPE